MSFGSEENFELIRRYIEDGDFSAELEIEKSVTKYAKSFLIRQNEVRREDIEDIIQEVLLAVFTHLQKFYCNSQYMTEVQRNAWLKRIVQNKKNDYLRKNIPISQIEEPKEDPGQPGIGVEDIVSLLEKRDVLEKALRNICGQNSSLERILAVLLNIYCAASRYKRNGSPSLIAKEMKGVPLTEIASFIISQYEGLLGYTLPEDIRGTIFEMASASPEARFTLSTKSVTDCTNYIIKEVKKSE